MRDACLPFRYVILALCCPASSLPFYIEIKSYNDWGLRHAGPPKILRIDGMKPNDEYLAGDELECVVYSNPPSAITWQNRRTFETTNGPILIVKPGWAGHTDQLMCSANGVVINEQFYAA